jgi:Cornifin (SPRR) family
MTAATDDEAWIQGSLARLETLEAQRAQLTARGQTAALAEIDEEIHALYEVLESAVGESAGQAPANMGMVPQPGMGMVPPPGMGMAPPPGMGMAPPPGMGMAPPPGMGMAPPPGMGMAPPPGMGMAPPPGMGMAPPPDMGMGMAPQPNMGMAPPPGMVMAPAPMDTSTSYSLLDGEKPPRSPLPFVVGGVLALVLVVGGIMALGKGDDTEAKPAPTEAKVIKSGDIAEDTQEPNVAKGGDADRVQGTRFKEGPPEDRSDARRPSNNGGGNTYRPRPKKDDDRKITVTKSRDPLAGID